MVRDVPVGNAPAKARRTCVACGGRIGHAFVTPRGLQHGRCTEISRNGKKIGGGGNAPELMPTPVG
jgi:hypothetical protein